MTSVCKPCNPSVFHSGGWCTGYCYGEPHETHSVGLQTEYVNPQEKTEGWCTGYCYGVPHDPHPVILLW